MMFLVHCLIGSCLQEGRNRRKELKQEASARGLDLDLLPVSEQDEEEARTALFKAVPTPGTKRTQVLEQPVLSQGVLAPCRSTKNGGGGFTLEPRPRRNSPRAHLPLQVQVVARQSGARSHESDRDERGRDGSSPRRKRAKLGGNGSSLPPEQELQGGQVDALQSLCGSYAESDSDKEET